MAKCISKSSPCFLKRVQEVIPLECHTLERWPLCNRKIGEGKHFTSQSMLKSFYAELRDTVQRRKGGSNDVKFEAGFGVRSKELGQEGSTSESNANWRAGEVGTERRRKKGREGKWYGKHVKTCCCMLNSGTQLRGAGRIGGSNHTCEIWIKALFSDFVSIFEGPYRPLPTGQVKLSPQYCFKAEGTPAGNAFVISKTLQLQYL